jgi:hypothetical protein
MNEWIKTALLLVAAAAAAALVRGWTPAPPNAQEFSDQGERFFPAFNDPLKAVSLEVVEYDEQQAVARPFKVHFKDGRWSIPSHYDYPADAKDRLKNTAASLIDLKKDAVRSDLVEEHEALGVVDPMDDQATTLKGRGKRVTIRDAQGGVLADFIVGQASGREGMRYVRVPDKKRTYAARMDQEVSAKFSDWIETDLLQLDRWEIRKVVIDSYSVDERRGTIENRQQIVLDKGDSWEWKMEGMEAGKEVNSEKVGGMTEALDELKIVDVRPKPQGLTQDLKTEGGIQMSQEKLLSLQSKGFFMTRDGTLVSNEGELGVHMKEGVVYTLRFGEVLVGEGGSEGEGEAGAGKKGEHRYLFVTVAFDPALTPEPEYATAAEGAAEEERKNIEEENGKKKSEWTSKVDEVKKKVEKLTERFAQWYYVIPAETYQKLRLTRDDLIQEKKKE